MIIYTYDRLIANTAGAYANAAGAQKGWIHMADTNTNTQTGAQDTGAQTNTQQQTGAASGAAGGNGATGTQQKDGGNLSAFDQFLQQDGMQAEFDRRVSKALETQKGKMTATIQQQIEAAVTEAQKLAKMTKDQQDEYNRKKKDDELAKREAAITRRELTATAKDTLASKGLPLGLADILDYTSADTANASIAAVETAFQAAVQTAVEAKLKGGKAPDKAGDKGGDALQQQIAQAIRRGFSA